LHRGEGYLWAPGHGILNRVNFPSIRTFDSSRTPKRGERLATPRTLAEVDLTAIVAALAAAKTEDAEKPKEDPRRHVQLEAELATAKARIDTLEEKNRELTGRLERIAALAAAGPVSAPDAAALPEHPRAKIQEKAGDIAVVDRAREPVNGSIILALLDGAFTVKRYRLRDGAIAAPAAGLLGTNHLAARTLQSGALDREVLIEGGYPGVAVKRHERCIERLISLQTVMLRRLIFL
jgi:peptidase S24-like protein